MASHQYSSCPHFETFAIEDPGLFRGYLGGDDAH